MNLEQARTNMIKQQVRAWNVLDEKVLQLLAQVPRELFVAEEYRQVAFADVSLPLGHGQVMWTPKEEGRMLQAVAIQASDMVLEVGTGSGYVTALLAQQAKHVHSIDIFPEFITQAQFKLERINVNNVTLQCADATKPWVNAARYDVIVVTGSVPVLPVEFQQLLAISGRLYVIVGNGPVMQAQLVTRQKVHDWSVEVLFETVVPPLYHVTQPALFEF